MKTIEEEINEEARRLIILGYAFAIKEQRNDNPTISEIKGLVGEDIDYINDGNIYVASMEWKVSDVDKLRNTIENMSNEEVSSFKPSAEELEKIKF